MIDSTDRTGKSVEISRRGAMGSARRFMRPLTLSEVVNRSIRTILVKILRGLERILLGLPGSARILHPACGLLETPGARWKLEGGRDLRVLPKNPCYYRESYAARNSPGC